MSADKQQYYGMDVSEAHALAHKLGHQLRVLTRSHMGATITHRYAEPPADHEILVDVRDNKISRVQ